MKREIFIHTISFLLLFVIIAFLKGYLDINGWQFWLGGVIGTILPDLDHIVYVYWLKPYELTSQRVVSMSQKGQLIRAWQLLASTRSERTNLVFHTAIFEIFFVILAFWVLTSSGSILGRGIVLAFLLHLSIDKLIDYLYSKNLNNWTSKLNIVLDNTQTVAYIAAGFLVILIFGNFL